MRDFSQLIPPVGEKRLFILDLDGTIVPDKSNAFSPAVIEQVKKFATAGQTIICSNGSPERARTLASLAGVQAVPGHKPWPSQLSSFLAGHQVLVVGDKYLTDGLLAKKVGGQFIKVRRLVAPTDSWLTRLSYGLDDFIWAIVPGLQLLRPTQWVKNLLVLSPLFFANGLKQINLVYQSVVAAVIFSVAASTVYVVNDLVDQATDRRHSKKQFRPLPAGRLSGRQASMILFALLVLLIGLLIKWPASWPVIVAYLILNLMYSGWFKSLVLVDILAVAVFYVLRVVAGGLATGLHLSIWILLCTFFGALFVVAGKRRAEFEQVGRRQVLAKYSKRGLDLILFTSAILATTTYLVWTIFGLHNHLLIYSTALVAAALGFLLRRIYSAPLLAESPESLVFKDPWILGTFCLWLVFVFSVFYLV